MKLIRHIALIIAVFTSCNSLGQEANARFAGANPDKHTMKIGEQVLLELSFRHHDTSEIVWPVLTDTLKGGVEIVRKSNISSTETKGIFTLTQNLMITAWDSGHFAIEPFLFIFGDDSIHTRPLLLSIGSVPVDTTKAAKDIKNIYADRYEPDSLAGMWEDVKDNWPWILAGVILAIGVVGAIIYYRRKNREPELAPRPKVPAHIYARQQLDQLEKEKLWQQGKVKEFHVRLTNILRLYIEQQFRVRAMEQTSDEILRNIRFTEMDDDSKRILTRVLKLSDMVKFAKEKPVSSENEQSLSDARIFVKSTEPKKEVEKEPITEQE